MRLDKERERKKEKKEEELHTIKKAHGIRDQNSKGFHFKAKKASLSRKKAFFFHNLIADMDGLERYLIFATFEKGDTFIFWLFLFFG